MAKKTVICLSEEREQFVVVQWMELKRITFIHVPNEGKRSRLAGAKLKAQGLKPGFPDLLIFDIPPKRPGYRGVAIEMKKLDGRATDMQKEWLKKLRELGWFALVCEGADKAIKALEELGF